MQVQTVETDKNAQNELFLNLANGRELPPKNFAYVDLVKSSNAAKARKLSKTLFSYKPENRPAEAFQLGMASWRGDALADRALLAMEAKNENPMSVIDTFLEQGIDGLDNPPEEFRTLWNQISVAPSWLDWDLLEHGAKVYRRYGVTGFQFQGIASIDGYRLESIGKTLMSTGQYADDTAFKRFLLTCNFWTEISEPEGMRNFSAGWKTALRVRLLHTLIRRAVMSSPNWNAEELGMPINQVGLLGAPLISSVMIGYLLKMLGYRPTDRDIDGMMHLWRYVSHIMGLEPGLFPETREEGLQLIYDMMNLEAMTDSPEGIELGSSFLRCFEPTKELKGWEKISRWIEYKTNIAQTLFFVSPETRKLISAPNPKGWALLYWLWRFPTNFTVDTLRTHVNSFDQAYDKRVSAKRRAWLNRQISEADLVYRPQPKY